VLSLKTVNRLSDRTKHALGELKIDNRNINPVATVGIIERELIMLGAQLASSEAHHSFIRLGGVQLDTRRLRRSLGMIPGVAFAPDPLAPCDFQTGVGDLLLVKQTLKAYELAEFAHVENVLAGESREREHRRLNLREEIETNEEERETAKERDLQSTDRN